MRRRIGDTAKALSNNRRASCNDVLSDIFEPFFFCSLKLRLLAPLLANKVWAGRPLRSGPLQAIRHSRPPSPSQIRAQGIPARSWKTANMPGGLNENPESARTLKRGGQCQSGPQPLAPSYRPSLGRAPKRALHHGKRESCQPRRPSPHPNNSFLSFYRSTDDASCAGRCLEHQSLSRVDFARRVVSRARLGNLLH